MSLADTFKDLQTELQSHMTSRQRLETQFQENRIVLDEFEAGEGPVYKLIGPVLLPQDRDEAKMNVEKRLEFIKGEIDGVEAKMAKTRDDLAKVRNSLVEAQVPKA